MSSQPRGTIPVGWRPACFYLLSPDTACYYTFPTSCDVVVVPGQLPRCPLSVGDKARLSVRRPARLFAVSRGRRRQESVCRADNTISRERGAVSLDCFRGCWRSAGPMCRDASHCHCRRSFLEATPRNMTRS